MSKRLIVGIVALVLLLSGGVAWVYVTFFSDASGVARLLPQDAPVLLSFATDRSDGDVKGGAELYEAYSGHGILTAGVERSLRNVYGLQDLSYQDDVRPWLGREIVLAKVRDEGKLALFVHVEDVEGFGSALAELQGRTGARGTGVEEKEYRGVQYRKLEISHDDGEAEDVFVFFVKRYLVVVFDESEVEMVVDVAKGDVPSLATNASYLEVEQQYGDNRAVMLYLDTLPQVRDALGGVLGVNTDDESFDAYARSVADGVGARLAVSAVGFDVNVDFGGVNLDEKGDGAVRFDSKAAGMLPAGVGAFYEGGDAGVVSGFSGFAGEDFAEVADVLTGVVDGATVERLVVALVPREAGDHVGGFVELGGKRDAEELIGELYAAVERRAGQVGSKLKLDEAVELDGVSWRRVGLRGSDRGFYVGQVDEFVVYAASEEEAVAFARAVNGKGELLVQRAEFAEGVKWLEDEKAQGFVFIDVLSTIYESRVLDLTADSRFVHTDFSQTLQVLLQFFPVMTYRVNEVDGATELEGFWQVIFDIQEEGNE